MRRGITIRTCLVGGSGFIGSALSQELIKSGREVSVIDHHPPLSNQITFHEGDYGDEKLSSQALKGTDEVVMLAYGSVPKTSFEDPFADIQSNLPHILGFFRAMVGSNVKKIIIVSSGGTVYGIANQLPIPEDHPTHPISPYGITKLAIEKYAQLFHHLYQIPHIIIRPGNAYGPGQRPFKGQGLVTTAIASVLQQKELTLFGATDIQRDYIYVFDLAKAILATLDSGKVGEIYNVGTGVGISNKEVVDLIYQQALSRGLDPKIKLEPVRPFDVPVNILDASKLTKETGWKPQTSFEDGLRKTWTYLEKLDDV